MPGAPPPVPLTGIGNPNNSFITYNTTAGDKTQAAGANPKVGDVIVVIWGGSGVTGITPGCTDNNADGLGTGGGAYTLVTTGLEAASVDKVAILVRNKPIGVSGAMSVTTTGQSTSTGGGLGWFAVTGMIPGAAGIRQSNHADNQASGVAPTVSFASAAKADSLLIGSMLWSASTNATAPTGWTTTASGSYTTPTQVLRTIYRPGGFSGTAVTFGTTATATWGMVICEIPALVEGNVAESYLSSVGASVRMQAFEERSVAGRRIMLPRRKIWRPSIVVPQLRFAS